MNKIRRIFNSTTLLLALGCIPAGAQLTINANFNTSDFTGFYSGSTPIANLSDAATIETTINQAIAQVDSLVSTPLSLNINFLSVNSGLGSSVGTGMLDLSYSSYLSYLQASPNKSSADLTALASLPTGPGTGVNNNATQVALGGALLDAIGDTSDGNSSIAANNGFAGTIALNTSIMNLSRNPYDPSKYDLFSTVTHEVDEILGIGGAGSTLTASGGATDIGPLDLYRYSGPGVKSYSNSANTSSYFSINGGNIRLAYFNQNSGGDYADWGDGVVPADGSGNNPPQVQDAFGDSTAEPNMGPNEVTALDVVGWNLTPTGLALEVPEPSTAAMMMIGLSALLCLRRFKFAC